MKLKSFFIFISVLLFLKNISSYRVIAGIQPYTNQIPIQYEVTVTLKLIQVYITDKDGNPLMDLAKEDFIIYDNGKEQRITEFERHILSFPSINTDVQPEIIKESKLPAARELMSPKFFLLFDFAYNNPRGILKAKKAALHFIDTKLKPSDEVSVLSYSAIKSLTLHEYLTTDHVKLREVVESFGLKEINGRAENFEAEYWGLGFADASTGVGRPGRRKESIFQAANFAQKMMDLAKALRYISGYKHIILFSSGVPYSLIYGYGIQSLRSKELRSRLIYEDMLKELAASNCRIYALDTEDLSTKIGVNSTALGIFTMQKMADSTGGKYFGNINSYEEHLEKIQKLTGCFYVLGYYIDEKWDGKYHKIKVKVNRPGCKIHAQEGYFNPKPFSEYSKSERMLHLVDLALSERPLLQTPVRFPVVPLPCSIKGKANLALFSKIPMEEIQELSGKDVEIVSIIFDEENNVIKIEREEKDFSKLPKGNIYYFSLVSLGPGDYKCRLVIRNLETGRGAVASSPAKIPKDPDYGIQLYPPLLLKSEKDAFYLKKPSMVFPFDSSQYSPLMEELERGAKAIFAVLRCSFSDIQQPDIKLSANLIHHLYGTEKTIPITISILNRHQEDDTEIYLIELQTEELRSGEYFLYVFAEEKNTKSSSRVNTSFKVK